MLPSCTLDFQLSNSYVCQTLETTLNFPFVKSTLWLCFQKRTRFESLNRICDFYCHVLPLTHSFDRSLLLSCLGITSLVFQELIALVCDFFFSFFSFHPLSFRFFFFRITSLVFQELIALVRYFLFFSFFLIPPSFSSFLSVFFRMTSLVFQELIALVCYFIFFPSFLQLPSLLPLRFSFRICPY